MVYCINKGGKSFIFEGFLGLNETEASVVENIVDSVIDNEKLYEDFRDNNGKYRVTLIYITLKSLLEKLNNLGDDEDIEDLDIGKITGYEAIFLNAYVRWCI